MEYHTSVDIDAAPERVWSVLADVERWPEWTPSMTRVERLERGVFGVGSKARVKQPRLRPAVYTVTDFAPAKAFTWTAKSPGVTSEGAHHLTPRADGGVTVTLIFRLTGPLAGPVGLLGGSLIRRYVRMEANGLKRRCEQG